MSIKTISEEGQYADFEEHTCDTCGRVTLTGVGGDVACCLCEFEREN